ncbi:alpha/beta hydrolase [Sphingobium aquiterrae]|uniref:alpha/beta fold hydrolase n=1 Tax=Sphingobium aquiterrae TaxID=2038656 RepID=UPI003017228F
MADVLHEIVAGSTGRLAVNLYGWPGTGATPLILVHPVNTGGGVWHRVAAALSLIRPVIVPDLRGHGASGKDGPFRAADYAADVLAVLDHLRVPRVHVAGGSIGGPVGILLDADVPQRIVSIASFGGALTLHLPDEAIASLALTATEQGGDGLIQMLLPTAFGKASRTRELVNKAISIASGRDAELIIAIIRGAFATDVTAQAMRCRAPALIVNGSEDATCPPEAGATMANAIRGRFVGLDGIGHLPMMEVPEMVTALLCKHCTYAEANDA